MFDLVMIVRAPCPLIRVLCAAKRRENEDGEESRRRGTNKGEDRENERGCVCVDNEHVSERESEENDQRTDEGR